MDGQLGGGSVFKRNIEKRTVTKMVILKTFCSILGDFSDANC